MMASQQPIRDIAVSPTSSVMIFNPTISQQFFLINYFAIPGPGNFSIVFGEDRESRMQYLHHVCLKDNEDCHLLLDSPVSDDKEVEKTKTNNYKLFGFVPRYGYRITFIPFFPF